MSLQFKEDFRNILIGLVLQIEERIHNVVDPLTHEFKSWTIWEALSKLPQTSIFQIKKRSHTSITPFYLMKRFIFVISV